jgi:ubiquinone biosynthesis protein UbiJ
VRWYAAHRLAELAFHGWDLNVSLSRAAIFSDGTANLLLPMLLESNVPRTYAAGLSEMRGSGERYVLRTPSAAWTVTVDPDLLHVERGQHPADVSVTAPPGVLALLVYGRTSLQDPAIRVEGDSAAAERFASVFPKP